MRGGRQRTVRRARETRLAAARVRQWATVEVQCDIRASKLVFSQKIYTSLYISFIKVCVKIKILSVCLTIKRPENKALHGQLEAIVATVKYIEFHP